MESTLADRAYDYILDLIFQRKIGSGDKIDEKKIAEDMQISRTPVREAIRKLVLAGILDTLPNKATFLHTFSDQQIRDLGLVRLSTDMLAIQLAILNGSNLDYMELDMIAKECSAAMDSDDLFLRIKLDSEFHRKLVEIGKNEELLNMHNHLALKTRLLQTQLLGSFGASCCDLSEHDAIVIALKERNLESALKVAKNHLVHFYKLERYNSNIHILLMTCNI